VGGDAGGEELRSREVLAERSARQAQAGAPACSFESQVARAADTALGRALTYFEIESRAGWVDSTSHWIFRRAAA
jgi:hypothetical protein